MRIEPNRDDPEKVEFDLFLQSEYSEDVRLTLGQLIELRQMLNLFLDAYVFGTLEQLKRGPFPTTGGGGTVMGYWQVQLAVALVVGCVGWWMGYRACGRDAAEDIRVLKAKLHFENREPPHCPTCDCGSIELMFERSPPV